MFVVIMISILIFTMVDVRNVWLRSLIKLAAFPLVAGISYEVIRLAGKYQNVLTRAMVFPGLMMQYITTKEPDDGQIEVAIASLKAVLEDEEIIDKAPTEEMASEAVQAAEQGAAPGEGPEAQEQPSSEGQDVPEATEDGKKERAASASTMRDDLPIMPEYGYEH